MSAEEMKVFLIDQLAMLQEIKAANGGQINEKLDYRIKVACFKLRLLGLDTESLTI